MFGEEQSLMLALLKVAYCSFKVDLMKCNTSDRTFTFEETKKR